MVQIRDELGKGKPGHRCKSSLAVREQNQKASFEFHWPLSLPRAPTKTPKPTGTSERYSSNLKGTALLCNGLKAQPYRTTAKMRGMTLALSCMSGYSGVSKLQQRLTRYCSLINLLKIQQPTRPPPNAPTFYSSFYTYVHGTWVGRERQRGFSSRSHDPRARRPVPR